MAKTSSPKSKRPSPKTPSRSKRVAWTHTLARFWRKRRPAERRILFVVALALLIAVAILGLAALNPAPDAPRPSTAELMHIPPVPSGPADVWSRGTTAVLDAPDGAPIPDYQLRVAEPVTQLGTQGTYSRIRTDRGTGYVASDRLSPLPPLTQAADVLPGVKANTPLTTAQQTELLARLIYAEAGNQTLLCQVYTGSVVLNRAKGDPDNIEQVIFTPGAFDVVTNRAIFKEPTHEALTAARELMTYGSRLPEYVVYFHRYDTDTAWTRRVAIYVQEDEVVFGYAPTDPRVPSNTN